jgi:hypothetical protein
MEFAVRGSIEGATTMSDQLFGESSSHPPGHLVVGSGYGLRHFIYLGTISIATIGWLWLIARVAQHITESVW